MALLVLIIVVVVAGQEVTEDLGEGMMRLCLCGKLFYHDSKEP